MPETAPHDPDHVDACRARAEAQVVMWREVSQAVRGHGEEDLSRLESALDSLEAEYFNNMLIVLESYFEGPSGGGAPVGGRAGDEVRLLCRSLREGGGTVLEDGAPRTDPSGTVLGLSVGDPIALSQEQYVRLADAFFREVERGATA